MTLKSRSDLPVRALSGSVLIVGVLTSLWIGGGVFSALLLVCLIILLWEWSRLIWKIVPGMMMRLGLLFCGIVYMAMSVSALAEMRELHGIAMTLWVFAIVWATDIGAYFAGRQFGGPKLAPSISPSKTWSGLIGGGVCAGVVGWLIADQTALPITLYGLGAPLAVVSQGGDLLESWMKRRAGVKDSGSIIPGHGGLFDRLDGMIPVSIMVLGLLRLGLI